MRACTNQLKVAKMCSRLSLQLEPHFMYVIALSGSTLSFPLAHHNDLSRHLPLRTGRMKAFHFHRLSEPTSQTSYSRSQLHLSNWACERHTEAEHQHLTLLTALLRQLTASQIQQNSAGCFGKIDHRHCSGTIVFRSDY
jgi:hypothetical protein